MTTITLSQCTLRPWKESDAGSIQENANNPKIACFLRDAFPYPYTLKDAEKWIAFITKNTTAFSRTIDVDGNAVGGIGIHFMSDVYAKNAEIGYWLGENYWGKGIVSTAVVAMVNYTFKNYDINRVFAGIYHPNTASMRVLEKCGFKKEAILKKSVFKNGEYLDEHVYSLLREDWEKL